LSYDVNTINNKKYNRIGDIATNLITIPL